MSAIPFASFLAGSLLSLLLPTLLLIGLVVWYWKAVRRVPDTTTTELGQAAPARPGEGEARTTAAGTSSGPGSAT